MKIRSICFSAVLGIVLSAGIGVRPALAIGDIKEITKIANEQSPEKDKFEMELPIVTYTSENLKDPFAGTVIPESAEETSQEFTPLETVNLPDIKIQGIIWGTNNPQAIINNKVVKVGSTVNEITILDITGSEIIISYKNQKFALPAPSGIKTPNVQYKGGSRGK
jgi:hypothetical protein